MRIIAIRIQLNLNMKKIITTLFVLITLFSQAQKFDYLNSSLPIEQRVELLMAKMTIEEKAAQLCLLNVGDSLFDSNGNIDEDKVMSILPNGIGSLTFFQAKMPMEKAIRLDNMLQKVLVEKSRLGIPCMFIGEGLHGFMGVASTSFPQAIALSCSWDTALIEQVFSATAHEMRVRGFHQALSPVIDLAREPRWGRTEETYGEDPYLTSRIGKAAILGFQGRGTLIDNQHVIATLKHFAGHGQSEGGNNISPIVCDERYFRENHLYPFEIAVKEAKVKSVMPSYNEWSAIPNHANSWLLNTILRGEWGFDGYIISDQGGIEDLYRKHFVANDPSDATRLAMEAGVNMELMDVNSYYRNLPQLIKKGIVSEKDLDYSVRLVLLNKFRLGLFESPYADLEQAVKTTNSQAHKNLALKAAHESIVLLKNENNLLPLDAKSIKTLAVIGPNAAEIHLGGYSIEPRTGTSVLEGINNFAKGKFDVKYAEGCKITTTLGSFWDNDNTIPNDEKSDMELIKQATETAKNSDVVLLVIGENESICREAWAENHRGDRDDLSLWGNQEKLVKAILETGKPVVVLFINGRPITSNYVAQNVPAILEGWYLGQETGIAVADVLFGNVNPSGKLSITIPKNIGQLPAYYSKKPSRNRNYVNSDMTPLYPFGFGLSYTTFEYGKTEISNTQIKKSETIKASISIKNTGKYTGDEIVQLYIRDKVSSVTRPILELKDFAKITLAPGEKKTVEFTINHEKLQFYNIDMNRVVEPGEFEVLIGPNCTSLSKALFTVTE